MPDREKVIEELRELRSYFRAMAGVASSEQGQANHIESARMIEDAIILLKAQEPRSVHITAEINYRKIGECPTCGKPINSGDYPNYCGQCGQEVKWE